MTIPLIIGLGVVLLIAVVLVVVGLSAYWAIGQYRAKQLREVRRLLGVAADALKNDSYDSYQKAAKAAGQALDVDPNSAQAHAYAAYANVIRWGEHGGDENVRQQAEEHEEVDEHQGQEQ